MSTKQIVHFSINYFHCFSFVMNVAIFLWHGKVVKSKMTIFGADIDIILSFVEVISSNNNIFFRPCLSWRDVQHIIAITAVKVWRNSYLGVLFSNTTFNVSFIITLA